VVAPLSPPGRGEKANGPLANDFCSKAPPTPLPRGAWGERPARPFLLTVRPGPVIPPPLFRDSSPPSTGKTPRPRTGCRAVTPIQDGGEDAYGQEACAGAYGRPGDESGAGGRLPEQLRHENHR